MKIFLLIIATILLTSCAAYVPVELICIGDLSGFWSGLWHGLIIFFSFIGSLFSEAISIYSICNTGGWYDFGFYLGTAIAFGAGFALS